MFKHLDNFLKDKKIADQNAIENAVDDFINAHNREFYGIGIEKLVERCQKCVNADRNNLKLFLILI